MSDLLPLRSIIPAWGSAVERTPKDCTLIPGLQSFFQFKGGFFMTSEQQCSGSRIAGCSFSIHPMSDNFIEIITNASENVDTSKVWMQTDDEIGRASEREGEEST